jgi:hypothetical protein
MNDLNPSRKPAIRSRGGRFRAYRGVASARSGILILLPGLLAMSVTQAADRAATDTPSAIPWSEIGAKAGADYKGDGLVVTPTESGARLHCVFQRLDGEATSEGLWLISTVTNTVSDRFRVTAMEVDRKAPNATFNFEYPESSIPLADAGEVSVSGQTARFSRPGLTEEYSVSMDGVRQDFIVEDCPGRARLPPSLPSSQPAGELVVKLAVSGAQVEPAADGARLVLTHSGRKIAYSRLRVTDATGKELPARIDVSSAGDEATSFNSWIVSAKDIDEQNFLSPAANDVKLAVVVNDAEAVYPVRIDPTFSDANWSALGSGFSGVGQDGGGPYVLALAVSGDTLYAGGNFTTAGGNAVTNIAQWNGSTWSALGSGMNDVVWTLAVSGSTLYAGGDFTTAGGSAANYIAQWNGSSWSALGSGFGVGSAVYALAVSGSTLYAGGYFTTAGGSAANYIARWNGSSWSALGSGMNNTVAALAVSGSTLYAGGDFYTAGGSAANYIAKWNGSSWSALGPGMSYEVFALAVSGGTLYAGGYFTTAGGNAATNIAQWNGSSWSALGSGMSAPVLALAVSGSTLYAGGDFTTAGSSAANSIAQWNGSIWSALGSGMNDRVWALAVSGSTLYAGGDFTTAGTNAAAYAAMANLAGTPVSVAIITTNGAFGFTGGVFGFDVTGPSGTTVVIQASTDLQTWIPLQTNLLDSGLLYYSDAQSPGNVQRFYRAHLSP